MQNIDANVIESIFNEINPGVTIGKKKRTKLRNLLRSVVIGGPSTSLIPVTISSSAMETNDVEDDEDLTPNVIDMVTGELEIVLDEHSLVYNQNNLSYDPFLIASKTFWHQIVITHNRRYSKNDIIPELYHIIQHDYFFPIAYRQGRDSDYFFVHGQEKALQRLFLKNLQVKVKGGPPQNMTVKLGVSRFRMGQIKPSEKILAAIQERVNNCNLHGGPDVLNLDSFSTHEELREVIVNLGNKSVFTLFCSHLSNIDRVKNQFIKFKMASNNLSKLDPFTSLENLTFKVLDLRYNQIFDLDQFKYLRNLNIEEIYLTGNAVEKIPRYQERIKEMIPSLLRLDGMEFTSSRIANSVLQTLKAATLTLPATTKKIYKNCNDPIKSIMDGLVVKTNDVSEYLKVNFVSFNDKPMWHQVILNHEKKATKDELLEELFSMCGRVNFFPCYYRQYAKHDEFYLYKCFDAIHDMILNNLVLNMPNGNFVTIILKMKIAEFIPGQVDFEEKINYVLHGRYLDGVLDLNDFIKDVDFDLLIVPMCTASCVAFVVDSVRVHSKNLHTITAQNNYLTNCDGFRSLTLFSKLRTLDLSNNNISDLKGIPLLRNVKSLILDGNPICAKFSNSPSDYVAEVRKYFPDLEYLDNRRLEPDHNWVVLQNYLSSPNAYLIAEEFTKHYFGIYDTFQRPTLKELYRDKSIFTLSVQFTPVRGEDKMLNRIQVYYKASRNIYRMVNFLQAGHNVVVGKDNIGNTINSLPQTEHDFTTFTIDVPIFEKTCVTLTVSGVFKELGGSLLNDDFILSFTRTFVLRPSSLKEGIFNNAFEYYIANDQLHISSATIIQKKDAFRVRPVNEEELKKNCFDLMPTEFEDKEAKLLMFKELTELKKDWCFRLLDENMWDIKVALVTFCTLMDSRELKKDCFDLK